MRQFNYLFAASAVMGLAACSNAPETPAPDQTSEKSDVTESASSWRLEGRAMAAAADPRAVKAATDILEQGGHAVDAAIAAHAVLGLVEPQSSGIGGGAFMVVYDHASGKTYSYDGREAAPSAIDENLFYGDDGKPLGYVTAWQSGRSVGVPSVVRLYEQAHADFGKTQWGDLFLNAQNLAEGGFIVSPRLAGLLSTPRLRAAMQLDDREGSKQYFYPEETPLAAGDKRTNLAYAAMLGALADNGADWFYTGDIAQAIVDAVTGVEIKGALSTDDLANYKAVRDDALCGEYTSSKTYLICSSPPPSSGGVAQAMTMGLYQRLTAPINTPLGDQLIPADGYVTAFVDAQRLAYADRDHYVADDEFVTVPVDDLINPTYLEARAKERFEPSAPAKAGDPGAVLRDEPIIDMWGRDTSDDAPGTTHLSIVDIYGNAVSMTATVESPFGSSIWVEEGGFLLNNELTDFARVPRINGKLVANAPAPNKRPRSSMSPTIVFDENGDLFMITGSPGGNSIIAYVAKTLTAVLDWDKDAQTAVDLPNIVARGDTIRVETGVTGGETVAEILQSHGYAVQAREGENSGLHVIIARDDHYEGGADKRREGVAVEVVKTVD